MKGEFDKWFIDNVDSLKFNDAKTLAEKAFKAGFKHAIEIAEEIEHEQEFDDFPENLVEVMVKNGYVA